MTISVGVAPLGSPASTGGEATEVRCASLAEPVRCAAALVVRGATSDGGGGGIGGSLSFGGESRVSPDGAGARGGGLAVSAFLGGEARVSADCTGGAAGEAGFFGGETSPDGGGRGFGEISPDGGGGGFGGSVFFGGETCASPDGGGGGFGGSVFFGGETCASPDGGGGGFGGSVLFDEARTSAESGGGVGGGSVFLAVGIGSLGGSPTGGGVLRGGGSGGGVRSGFAAGGDDGLAPPTSSGTSHFKVVSCSVAISASGWELPWRAVGRAPEPVAAGGWGVSGLSFMSTRPRTYLGRTRPTGIPILFWASTTKPAARHS